MNNNRWGRGKTSMAKQYRKNEIKKEIVKKLDQHFGKQLANASEEQIYYACAWYVQNELYDFMLQTDREQKAKRKVHFLCMEFLLGKSLRNHAYNLGMLDSLEEALDELGYQSEKIFGVEKDCGLGASSLGGLAACYGDAVATIGVAGIGYTIRYEKGNFIQKIENGEQIELPDPWLETGSVWQIPRFNDARVVHIGGQIQEIWQNDGLHIAYKDDIPVIAIPHDVIISGYNTEHTATLRLWQATSPLEPDTNARDYLEVLQKVAAAQSISKVLYPDDSTDEGKIQRLRQQYFLVSATVQDICAKHKEIYGTLDNFAEKNVLHLNDTQPVLAIPELMRILLDEENMSWEFAWNVTTQSIAYTNHTMRQVGLEFWSVNMLESCAPRIMSIINEINHRYACMLKDYYPDDAGKVDKMLVVCNGYVNMANLAIIGSFSVNGVSALHEEMLKTRIFPELYAIYPARFKQITNGVSIRRWLCQANPELAEFVSSKIGEGFITHPSELHVLSGLGRDKTLLDTIGRIKLNNKKRLAKYIFDTTGLQIDVNTMFDIYCEYVHLHKRHLMYLMHIITIYNKIKKHEEPLLVPRTFIMCARAMPGHSIEKKIIRLANAIGNMINNDQEVNKFIKFVFLENYNVSLSEIVIPAAELAEQISLTGSEASGTNNMRFMMNGAIIIGTWDGANIEIEKTVGRENILLFGTQSSEAFTGRVRPDNDDMLCTELKYAIERIREGFEDGVDYTDVINTMFKNGDEADHYCIARDFASYCRTQERASQMYLRQQNWNYMSLMNIANSGRFAADRSVAEYAQNIWRVPSKFSF